MKLSLHLLRLLMLMFWCGANEMSRAAEVANTNALRVIVKPSKTKVRVNEPFEVALRVENVSTTNQHVRVMNCSWDEHWKTSNNNITWHRWNCTRNFAVTIDLAPGGAYTNRMELLVPAPSANGKLSFRMGFTPIASTSTLWSDDIMIEVMPAEEGKSTESRQRYNPDLLEILRKDLEAVTLLQKQRALETIMALGAIGLLPDVMKAIEDPTPLPRDGDTGWGFVGHEAATAMSRLAQMLDGVDLKQRGERAYSFSHDEGDGGEKLKASGRLAEVRRNWEQWRRNSVHFSVAVGGDFSNLDALQENAVKAALKAVRDEKVDTSRHEMEVPESAEPISFG